jgi:excisionase family DNA binding protein
MQADQYRDTADEWWSVEDIAKYFHVTRETVRRWVRAGKLHGVKPGGKTSPLRIHQEEVDRLVSPEDAA